MAKKTKKPTPKELCGEHAHPHLGPPETYEGPKCELPKGHRYAHKITTQDADGKSSEMQFLRGDPFKQKQTRRFKP